MGAKSRPGAFWAYGWGCYFYTNFLGLDKWNWKENRRWIANEICVYERDFLRQDPVPTSEFQVYITN